MLHPSGLQHLQASPPSGRLHHPQLQPLTSDGSDGQHSVGPVPPVADSSVYPRYLSGPLQAHQHPLHPPHPPNLPNPFVHNAAPPPLQHPFHQGPPTGLSGEGYYMIPSPHQLHSAPPHAQPIHTAPPLVPHGDHELGLQAEQTQEQERRSHSQFQGMKLIPDPPNLKEWRDRLFHVNEMITLTEDEFQTYFPHVDNVYSHRSTQPHKRKRVVVHYWECRLKGRPPGSKKSTDPNRHKRKRVARQRDLCDVKIKITEYFDAAEYTEQTRLPPPGDNTAVSNVGHSEGVIMGQTSIVSKGQVGWGMQGVGAMMQPPTAGPPRKIYTLERVNGKGGNGRGDGVPGPHRHTLEESDAVKKNSVVRWLLKNELERKKKMNGDPSKKTYHKKATGAALATVKEHSKDSDLKLYGSCFCPFVQRVWISLEHKSLPYQYIEVDPYKKPQSLLSVNPRGLVPALRHGPNWSCHESSVLMEYLEDLNQGPPLFPPDPQTKATCRLWTDHVNRHIVPGFYRLLQAQEVEKQKENATELRDAIQKLVDAADPQGPFFLGRNFGFVDAQVAPWVLRLKRVLGPYRGWPEPEEGSRWKRWVDAIEGEGSVKRTTSTDELYWDSYERYAENRPGTSEVARAVNEGRGLP